MIVKQDWREQALRAIRGGSCPNGHGRLDENGFCLHCGKIGVHYSIRDGDTVVCLYPEHLGGGAFCRWLRGSR